MIYVTGDTHGDIIRFIENNMEDRDWTENDYLMVCGDFGFVFLDNDEEEKKLDLLESKPYTICFCDGNHENFSKLNSYPKEEWCGGYVHKVRKNIIHLMRGQVFSIDGKKIFTMGGAYSIDRYMRILGESYWEEELPSNDEYKEAVSNLEKNNYSVDLIITHTAPQKAIHLLGKYPDGHDMELTGFLEWVSRETEYKHWYFGHWHLDRTLDEKTTAVYFDVHRVE